MSKKERIIIEKVRKTSFKNAEILFTDEGIKILERLKDEEVETDLELALRDFEGCANLAISITTKSEI